MTKEEMFEVFGDFIPRSTRTRRASAGATRTPSRSPRSGPRATRRRTGSRSRRRGISSSVSWRLSSRPGGDHGSGGDGAGRGHRGYISRRSGSTRARTSCTAGLGELYVNDPASRRTSIGCALGWPSSPGRRSGPTRSARPARKTTPPLLRARRGRGSEWFSATSRLPDDDALGDGQRLEARLGGQRQGAGQLGQRHRAGQRQRARTGEREGLPVDLRALLARGA